MRLELQKLTKLEIVNGLKARVRTERKIMAEIIEFIHEIDRQKIYLDYKVTSLFSFLVEVIGYSRTAAQRRLEAARLSNNMPEIQEGLKSGELNLSQVSLVAQCLKQKSKESSIEVSLEMKKEIFEKIKSKPVEECAVLIAKELDLKIKQHDVIRHQQDESIRTEMTFTKEEQLEIDRVKSLLSHQLQNPSHSELYMFLIRDCLKRKDPLFKKAGTVRAQYQDQANESESRTQSWAKQQVQNGQEHENPTRQQQDHHEKPNRQTQPQHRPSLRKHIPRATERALHQRDKSCRWKDEFTRKTCDSTFQLQKDHIVPLWAGGTDDLENLQLLCGVHNRHKYRYETNTTFTSDQRTTYEYAKVG